MWVLFGSNFMFSNFYRLYFQKENCVAWGSQWWSINKNRIEHWNPFLVIIIGSMYMFVVICIGFPSCGHHWFEVINKMWRHSPIKVKTFVLLVFVIDLYQTTRAANETSPLILETLASWKQMSNNFVLTLVRVKRVARKTCKSCSKLKLFKT